MSLVLALLLFIWSLEIGRCDSTQTPKKPIREQVHIYVQFEVHDGENKTGASNNPLVPDVRRHDREWYNLVSDCARENQNYACIHQCAFNKTGAVIGNQFYLDNIKTYLNIWFNSEKFAMEKFNLIKTNCDNDDYFNTDGSPTCGIPVHVFLCVLRMITRPYIDVLKYVETRPRTRGRKGTYREYFQNITECNEETLVTYGDNKNLTFIFKFYGSTTPCVMACVFRRNNVFVNGIFSRENFSQFRKRVWNDEYLAFATNFFPTQACLDVAAAMRDECMAAVMLDTCTENTPGLRPPGWYEDELSRIE